MSAVVCQKCKKPILIEVNTTTGYLNLGEIRIDGDLFNGQHIAPQSIAPKETFAELTCECGAVDHSKAEQVEALFISHGWGIGALKRTGVKAGEVFA